jgi:alpha-beta hydrolase superfamily lysophospholipase
VKQADQVFVGQRNVRIFWRTWQPPEARAAVVLVHGLGEHSGRYQHVAAALVACGCAVYALDLRGHGRSEGPRALVDRFANAVADIDALVNIAQRERRGHGVNAPIFLLGHSMGGALALRYAVTHGHKLAGLILSGPAVALDGAPPLMRPISKLLSRVAPTLGMFAIDAALVSRDQSAVAAYESDPLNAHGKVPARTLGEIVACVDQLPGVLGQVTLPLLILHGGDDRLAGVSGSQMVIKQVRSEDKTLKVYDGLYHEIFNEMPVDRERVLADLVAWVSAHLAH